MFAASISNVIARGQLKLTVQETGKTLLVKNLVIKNSPHITALSLGGDIITTSVKIASWGDNFLETPMGSYYNMTTLESLENLHAIDGNHTIKTLAVSGHSYPASKSVRFSFQYDRNSHPDFIGKNLLEFGLYFNDILYSRVALQEDNYFESWMTVVAEWTIIFSTCSGGYSNYLLNQYEISSLWTMDEVDLNFEVQDYAGRNNLLSNLPPARLISNLVGINPLVTNNDYIHKDALCTFFKEFGQENILSITKDKIYNDTLDLKNKFTLWQWFKFKDINIDPFILTVGGKWILFSRWVADSTESQCSYRLYLNRPSSSVVTLNFDINDGYNITTLTSTPLDVDILVTINIFNLWCLAAVVLNQDTKKLTLYLNDVEVASTVLSGFTATPNNNTSFLIGGQQELANVANSIDTTSIFRGFTDETGISPDVFSRSSLSLLWNNGFGNFYNP